MCSVLHIPTDQIPATIIAQIWSSSRYCHLVEYVTFVRFSVFLPALSVTMAIFVAEQSRELFTVDAHLRESLARSFVL